MPPRPFYEVDQTCYLYGKEENKLEEVRQWAMFELLSTYGYNIRNIQFDVPVEVEGDCFHAHLVVLKDNFPYIVIMCHQPIFSDSRTLLNLAIRTAEVLKARFAVLTHGSQWIVKRQFEDQWYPVVDIPVERLVTPRKMTSVLYFVENVKPLLYWTHQVVPKNQAQNYFLYLMEFYQSEIRSSYAFTSGLIEGTDYLLRILGHTSDENPRIEFHGSRYELNNLIAAQLAFNRFYELVEYVGFDKNMNLDQLKFYNFKEILGFILNDFRELAKFNRDVPSEEALLVKVVFAVAEYLWNVYEAQSFLDISPYLIETVNSFLNQIIYLEVGATLPEPFDSGYYEEMRILCSKPWKE